MINERGFMTAAFVILIPLIVTMLALLGASYLIFRNDGQARHTCRAELLRTQEKIAQDIRELTALNPEATALRLELRAARINAFLAPTPEAYFYIAQIEAKQMILSAQQKIILFRGKTRSRVDPYSILAKVRGVVATAQAGQADSATSGFRGSASAASFDMIASPIDSVTPDYEPAPTFQKSQEMRVGWSFNAGAMLPAWLRSWIKSEGSIVSGECSVTLEKKGLIWEPKITQHLRVGRS